MLSLKKSYSELSRLSSIDERFQYLKLGGSVAHETFGTERWLNQRFYRSTQWRNLRDHIIVRDNGCDLGVEGFELYESIYIHHLNPIRVEDLTEGNPEILDPEYLISVSHKTHNAIHYGDATKLTKTLVVRTSGDTRLW